MNGASQRSPAEKTSFIQLLTRRKLLLGAGAAAAVLAGGVAANVRGPASLIEAIWARALGPFIMAEEARERLIKDTLAFLHEAGASSASERLLGAGYSILAFPGVRSLLPGGLRFKIEQYERQALTYFLLNTDYIAKTGNIAGKEGALISYDGPREACQNPWAQFS